MHPSRDDLRGLVLGTLSEADADSVINHVGECSDCDETLRELETTSDDFVRELKVPTAADEYEREAECRELIAVVKAIGKEASFASQQAADAEPATTSDLGELGQYKLLAKLGQGGMGAVYKALHTRLRRIVALKVLPADRIANEDAVARFDREMQAVGQLNHPNIVAAHDAGEVDGMHYLVMELVEGIDLSKLVRRIGPLDVADACEVIRQAAIGLQHAHGHGMVHRDIKPSNLMLAQTDEGDAVVKVLDMGLALLDDGHAIPHRELTSTGQMMGTLDYMAPEQGTDSHEVDIRADVYSLGASLFKLLTAQAPFSTEKYNSALKLMMAKATEAAPSIATMRDDLPDELVAVIDRMLAKEPDDRFSTPAETAKALAPFTESADLRSLLDATLDISAAEASGVATEDFVKSGSHSTAPDEQLAPTIDASSTSSPGDEAVGCGESRTNVATPEPKVRLADSPHPTRRWITPATIVGTAIFVFLCVTAAVVIYIKTDYGRMVLEIHDEQIIAEVEEDYLTLVDTASGHKYAIMWEYFFETDRGHREHNEPWETGTYALDSDKLKLTIIDDNGAEYETDEFTLRRNGKVRARISLAASTPVVVPSTNYKLAFDGESSYVEVPSFNYDGGHPITIEARVRSATNTKPMQTILLLGECRLVSNLGSFRFVVVPDESTHCAVQAVSGFEPDRSYHLAGVYDGGDFRLYVDGRLQQGRRQTYDGKNKETTEGIPERISLQDLYPGEVGVFIGSAVPGGVSFGKERFHGTIDEVRISKVARYAEDFTPAERFEPDEHTLALYHFDEGQGDTLIDSSRNNHHGKIVGAKWVVAGERLVAPPITPTDKDQRELVDWVFRHGGDVSVSVETDPSWTQRTLKPKDVLPGAPFTVIRIFLPADARVNDEAVAELAQRFPWVELANFELYGNAISNDSLAHISRLYTARLGLADTSVTDEGLDHLREMRGLIGLNLPGAPITDEGVEKVLAANLPLKVLSLTNTAVSDTGLAHIAKIKTLEHLGLNDTRTTADGLAHLRQLPNLKVVQLRGVGVDDRGFEMLTQIPTLEQIELGGNAITDEGLSQIGRLKRLRVLYHPGNTSGMAEYLSKLDSLEVLWLNSCSKLTDDGLEELARLQQLKELKVGEASVSALGVAKLQFALPNCTIESDFTDEEIAAAMSKLKRSANYALQFDGQNDRVNLPQSYQGGHPFTMESWTTPSNGTLENKGHVMTLANFGVYLQRFTNGKQWAADALGLLNPRGTPAGAIRGPASDYLGKRQHVAFAVDAKGTARLFVDGKLHGQVKSDGIHPTARGTIHIGAGRATPPVNYYQGIIDEVRISNVARYTEDFAPAERFEPDEHTLALYHFDEGQGDTLIDSSGNDHHARIVGAKWVLSLGSDRPKMERRQFVLWALKNGASLRVIDDSERVVDIQTANQIPDGPFAVTESRFDYQFQPTADTLARIVLNAPKLERLIIEDAQEVTNASWLHLSDLTELKSLILKNGVHVAGLQSVNFERFSKLRTLDMSDAKGVNDDLIQRLAALRNIEKLILARVSLTDAAMPSLSQHKNLTTLELAATKITNEGIVHLRSLSNLQTLGISGTAVSDVGVSYLVELGQLESLKLDDTALTDEGLSYVSKLSNLWTLGISGTRITDSGLANIQNLARLEVLNLDNSQLTDAALDHLVGLTKLEELLIRGTQVTDDGLEQLAGLKELKSLSLNKTQVSPAGIAKLKLVLPECTIDSEFTDEEIAAAMEKIDASPKPLDTSHLDEILDLDFSRGKTHLGDIGRTEYEAHHLEDSWRMHAKKQGIWFSEYLTPSVANFVCEVDARLAARVAGEWCVGFRKRDVSPTSPWLSAIVSDEEGAGIHIQPGERLLEQMKPTSMLPIDQPNKLRIEVVDRNIRLFMNGSFIDQQRFERYVPGGIFFHVFCTGTPLDARFNRIRVWRIEPGGRPVKEQLGKLLFDADFVNPSIMFQGEYENARLVVRAKRGQTQSVGRLPLAHPGALRVETVAKVLGQAGDQWALVFQEKNNKQTWMEIRGDGHYRVRRVGANTEAMLTFPAPYAAKVEDHEQGWKPHSMLKEGTKDHKICVAVRGKILSIYIDDVWADDVYHAEFDPTELHLGVVAKSDEAAAEFKSLRVRRLGRER
jgi:serine/threonine protein kinase